MRRDSDGFVCLFCLLQLFISFLHFWDFHTLSHSIAGPRHDGLFQWATVDLFDISDLLEFQASHDRDWLAVHSCFRRLVAVLGLCGI
jgi:hypothetical protein